MDAAPGCPVCDATSCAYFLHAGGRDYWRCPRCEATILDPSQRPGPLAERAEYRLHRNAVDDPGYRRFLGRLATPLMERLAPANTGLD